MADKGAIGKTHSTRIVSLPRDTLRRGALTITGTARVNEVSTRTTVHLFGLRSSSPLMSVESDASGAFTVRNIAAGRYLVMVYGRGDYLPGLFAVDVS